MSGRKRYTAATSGELADKILDGEVEPEDAAREHGIQSYQLWAWVGKRAYERNRAARREAHRAAPTQAGARSYTLAEVLELAELLAKRTVK